MATGTRRRLAEFNELPSLLEEVRGFADVRAALQKGLPAGIDGAWGSACALSIAALSRECAGVLLVVLPRIADVDDFALDVAGFTGTAPQIFPAWETLPQEQDVSDPVFGGRLRILHWLSQIESEITSESRGKEKGEKSARPRTLSRKDRQAGAKAQPRIVVTSIEALLQPVPARKERDAATRTLRVGEERDRDELLHWLVQRGFERSSGVEVPGEFAVHGGILDVFPPDAEEPLRIEFFGDEIESIRRFDVETQRKTEELQEISLTLLQPSLGASHPAEISAENTSIDKAPIETENLLDVLPAGSWAALVELESLVEEGRGYLQRLDSPRGLFSVEAVLERAAKFPHLTLAGIAGSETPTLCHLQTESIERFSGPKSAVLTELAETVAAEEQVLIACHNAGEQQRLSELLDEHPALKEQVTLQVGHVSRGFRLVEAGLVVLSDQELFGRADLRRTMRRRKRPASRAIDNFLELRPGELVVHLAHGIGRFRGMKLMEKGEQREEHLILEFRDGVLVYVPVSLIHLVQKYVGAARAAPTLSKIGGTNWAKRKQRVGQAVLDMAADMIRLQAAREAQPGIVFPSDSHWQQEFEASFPYTETDDQWEAITDVKADMQRPRPMDRLICGDVGYGKTEVAMRAAFKAVEAGKQVAVLVPTTVLAEQHFRTFSERMAEYPVNIEVLSRFRSKKEQKKILEAMEKGGVDIVIGTHRLVQQDICFKDLGLLIIDEEQRFGVQAKELLKRMRLEVDVLTLSATPIPRTLHMSLLGIRDISNLVTPPQDRQSIETRICRFDADLIRRAVIRELNRGGQVYFVHNRVHNIVSVADRLQSIVPEAVIGIAHGQMPEGELEAAMFEFVKGRTDILVCTTIIESGLDIPNANTIFIHQAGNFGLADLHQLRGRVGRYKHRAYCYLLLDEKKPLTPQAAKRLKAVEEFSELGAGFKIAMRDLEIRGAGNILGTEQSGHISAVGYELYCRLLENAVRQLKNEPPRQSRHVAIDLPVSAYLPDSYIPPGRHKIDIYRKLSLISVVKELAELREELEDRFGPLPSEVQRLFLQKELQLTAWERGIDDIHLEEGYAVFSFRNAKSARKLRQSSRDDLRAVDAVTLYLPLPADLRNEELLNLLKAVLQPESAALYNPPPSGRRSI